MVRRYRVQERPNRAAAGHDRDEAEDVVAERLRIARELHDALSHSIATISVQAGSALYALGERRSEVVHSALTAIRETSKDTMQELRTTLSGLREGDGGEDRDRAGLARLPALLDAVRAAGLPVEVEVSGPPLRLDPTVDHCAYRILQESLTNVLRHAGPQASARIRICYDLARLAIEVTDDGAEVPAGLGEGKGLGLAGMRERAEAVGGACTAGPRPGGGFEVRALLPTGAAR
nr:histidine kinase [Actinomadura rayongensis]